MIKPLHDRVLVRRLEPNTVSAGGLVIPTAAQERSQEATVVAVGAGFRTSEGVILPLTVQVGDTVLIGKQVGEAIKVEDEDLLMIREQDIYAIVSAG